MRKADIQVGKTYERTDARGKAHARTVVEEGDARAVAAHPWWFDADDQDFISYRDDRGNREAMTRAAFARWAQREVVNG